MSIGSVQIVVEDKKQNHLILNLISVIVYAKTVDFVFFFFKKPNCQFPTILDLLDIDDPVIANCLIDQVMNVQECS